MTKSAACALSEERPRELQDPLNMYLYHPLAARLARWLAPTGVSPNLVSVGSAVSLVLATWAFLSLAWPINALAGLGFMIAWHIVDGADGDLARMTGKASATGELVDGVCDYFGNVFMYFAFAFRLDDTLGGWAWVLAWSAGGSHVLQTNHAETQRRLYAWRVYGRSWLRRAAEAGDEVFKRANWFTRWFGFWAVGYVWLSDRMSPSANPIDEALSAAGPEKAARIRALVRARSGASLALEKCLGANPKTLIIAASIALGSPAYYFLTTLVVLNLILVVSIVHHKSMERRLIAEIRAL
ncbi:CDP-alcohol phosphatidyltransferase family protein [Sphingosinicella sp.]|uniref:CDP-alcohol phosphatidyltransferase family protein n=1 Tax=Sphingosinicella sp. TaxID=1917971 RepID=UPI00403849B5